MNAKDWTLVSPEGIVYNVHNLNDWARDHTGLFGELPGDDAGAYRIACGFRVLKRSLTGKLSDGQRGVTTYKGWTLLI